VGGAGASTSAPAPWWDVKAQAASAINTWLSGVVSGATAPIAQVGGSLLDPRRLTGVTALEQLWNNSRTVANALFGLLILAGAMVIAGHETVQTRWALKEIAPRIVLGFLTANLSWTVITASITGAAALAVAVAGNGLAPGQILTQVLTATLAGGPIFTVLLQLVLLGVAVALVIGLVVVGVLLMLLTLTAPLALCLHALPQTEQIAYLWWRALGATLAIPVLQGLILALLARVVLQPGGYGLLGIPPLLTGAGTLLNLLVTLALLWVMVTLPTRMWHLATGRSGRGGGLVRGLVKTALGVAVLSGIGGPLGATLGRAAAGGRGMRTGRALRSMLATTPTNTTTAAAGRRRPRPGTTSAPNPWARVRQTSTGQLILPMPGVRRVPRPRPTPAPAASTAGRAGARRAPAGRQLALFSRAELLTTPRPRRDGQYEIPLHLTPTTAPARPDRGGSGPEVPRPTGKPGPRQRGLFSRGKLLGQPRRPASGQLALPLELTASPRPGRPPAPPTTRTSSAASSRAPRRAATGRQLSLYSPSALRGQPVLRRDGQYRLPIPLTPPPPAPTPSSQPDKPPRPTGPAPLAGQTALSAQALARPRRRPRRPGRPTAGAASDPTSSDTTRTHPNPVAGTTPTNPTDPTPGRPE
jgi:hypothetical protein